MNKTASELIARLEVSQRACFDAGLHVAAMDIQSARAEIARTAANQSGSERAGVDALRERIVELRDLHGSPTGTAYKNGVWDQSQRIISTLATPPAQPAPNPFSVSELWDMKTNGKPDGAVRALICAERQRQIDDEGYDASHDDEHEDGELMRAGMCYLNQAHIGDYSVSAEIVPMGWPWDAQYWKPTNPQRDLVKAGALFLAERDRLRRLTRYHGHVDHKLELAVRRLTALSPKIAAADDDTETCIACNVAFVEGDLIYPDQSGGCIHVSCCGPEMEGYVNADGEPLKDGDPLPTPQRWTGAAAETSPGDYDPEFVASILHADAVAPEAKFNNAVDMLNWLNRESPGDAIAMKEACKPFLACLVGYNDNTPDSATLYVNVDDDGGSQVLRTEHFRALKAAIDRLDVKAEAKSQEPEAVAIKPLRWVRSSVFGSYKWRGMSQDFGEVGCFTDVAYSDAQIDEKKAAIQADYEQRIRSALIHPTTKPEGDCPHCRNGFRGSDVECVNGVLIDIDEFTEGWQTDVLYPPAPCHPLFCKTCGGSGRYPDHIESDCDDCPDCVGTGYVGGNYDCQERLKDARS